MGDCSVPYIIPKTYPLIPSTAATIARAVSLGAAIIGVVADFKLDDADAAGQAERTFIH